jgi:hypothetical protein
MRTLKLILGIGCFAVALLPGGLALLVFSNFGVPGNIVDFCFTSFLVVLAISLVWTGWFLIARRGSPMSRKAKILISLPFFCIGVFVVVVLPNFIKARSTSSMNACINNLRQIDAAANEFALEKNLKTGDKINFPDDLTPYIKLTKDGKIPPCPQGGIYSIKKVGDVPTCSLGTTVTPAHILP